MLPESPLRAADTANALFVLFIVDCISRFANLCQLSTQLEHVAKGLTRELAKAVLLGGDFNLCLRQERHHCLANRGAISRISPSNARRQAHAARAFHLVEVHDLAIIVDAKVDCLDGVENCEFKL